MRVDATRRSVVITVDRVAIAVNRDWYRRPARRIWCFRRRLRAFGTAPSSAATAQWLPRLPNDPNASCEPPELSLQRTPPRIRVNPSWTMLLKGVSLGGSFTLVGQTQKDGAPTVVVGGEILGVLSHVAVQRIARLSPEGQSWCWWAGRESNPHSLSTADLQSAELTTCSTYPQITTAGTEQTDTDRARV